MRTTKLAIAGMLLILSVVALSGCGGEDGGSSGGVREVLYQYSTLDALMAGVYEGELMLGDLLVHGDLGLGTLNALDGELVVIDGMAYRVGFDGLVEELGVGVKTPFAVVTEFDVDITLEQDGPLSFDQLKSAIDAARPSANLAYAIRIDGEFAAVRTRSVPAQTRPYRPLPEVLEGQSEFELTDVEGTVVGFWLPAYMDGPNAGGYHLHFLTKDRKAGGHVLDLQSGEVTVALDETPLWAAQLPTEGDFLTTTFSDEQYK